LSWKVKISQQSEKQIEKTRASSEKKYIIKIDWMIKLRTNKTLTKRLRKKIRNQ
jgi:bifunctional ADP-heptose synthase (sugar kinase/adenylyltransferase)